MVLCEVCLEEFTSSSEIDSLVCGHIFHEKCLNDWFEKGKQTCPTCRKPFEDDTVHRHRLYVTFEEKLLPESEEERHDKEIARLSEENESLSSLCQSLEESIEEHKEEIASLRRLCKSLEETIRENNEIIKALQ